MVRICHSLSLPKVSIDVVAAQVSATWGIQGFEHWLEWLIEKSDQAVIKGYGSLED